MPASSRTSFCRLIDMAEQLGGKTPSGLLPLSRNLDKHGIQQRTVPPRSSPLWHNIIHYHCGSESSENTFKYYDKRTQRRYQCGKCQKLFTTACTAGPTPRSGTLTPRNRWACRESACCGMADNAPFKYYNNNKHSQPRFKCLSCGQQFQMRLLGTGKERHLVHTSCMQRQPSNQKLGLPADSDNDISKPMPVDPWMPGLELGEDYPALSVEDARYFDSIEAGLNKENKAPPPTAVLRLQLWASKFPQCGH